MNAWITAHARERLQEHHPNIGTRGALALLQAAIPVPAEVVAGFLARKDSAVQDRYLLAEDRAGIFVLVHCPERAIPDVLVTYIRLGQAQQDLAWRLYPWAGGSPILTENAA